MKKSVWLMSAGLFAIAAPAAAQDNTQSTGQSGPLQQAGEVDPNVDVSPTDDTDNGGDIIVTAQGRAQALLDVPLSVSAVSAESLQNSGATDIRALNQLAPSLLVSSTGTEANGSARIRGIGTVGDNPGLESSVAVFVDGVYRSRSGVGLNELGEVERIEVLRGPQGTLFGRNASAGLIHVISKRPNLNRFEAYGEATYGNYDMLRLAGGVTGPATEQIGFRLDGVMVQRDGYYRVINAANGTENRVNDRDRFFLRGQMLYEASDAIDVRIIGDYTRRTESCCAAAYRSTDETFDPSPGQPGDFAVRATNRVVNILTGLGGLFPTPGDRFSRQIAITPGRTYRGKTEDWGLSGHVNWNLGAATLTSITAYRNYDSAQGSDTDYTNVDLIFRAYDGNNETGLRRQFSTFTQELRLQGQAFDEKLDWLVGAYFADEELETSDNLKFGNDYGPFMACRILSGIARPAAFGGPAAGADDPVLRSPGAAGCLSPVGRGFLGAAFGGANAAGGTDASQIIGSLERLSNVRNVGFGSGGGFEHNSRNYAFFTHNIFHITDQLSVTAGLRYTNEKKDIQASFNNNNTLCPAQQAQTGAAIGGSGNATARSILGGAIFFSCLFNSTSSLNTLRLSDEEEEDQFTGTAVLSWKPNTDLLVYGSYSKGYKAGGYNLDASALGAPTGAITPANVANLRFDPETVDAYELGIKYNGRSFNFSAAAFEQRFRSFQLNTFNGLFFLVQNVNGCSNLVGGSGADEDASNATGTCAARDVEEGVISSGVELEAAIFPTRDLTITAGFTYVDTRYKSDLVGNIAGTQALAAELFQLPGNNLSNAPKSVVTSSMSWTPEIGTSGLSGLLYVDSRLTSDYNTGSDLFPEKEQDSFVTVNARVGLRGPQQRWGVEFWAQNLFNIQYDQVAFNSPLQASGAGTRASVQELNSPYAAQLFSAFLAEPRTYGITARVRF
jgi:outer membrane receptor protein involved in Fe transport